MKAWFEVIAVAVDLSVAYSIRKLLSDTILYLTCQTQLSCRSGVLRLVNQRQKAKFILKIAGGYAPVTGRASAHGYAA